MARQKQSKIQQWTLESLKPLGPKGKHLHIATELLPKTLILILSLLTVWEDFLSPYSHWAGSSITCPEIESNVHQQKFRDGG